MKFRICVLVLAVLPLTGCLNSSNNAATEDELFGELVPVDGEDQPEADASAVEGAQQEAQTDVADSERILAEIEELEGELPDLAPAQEAEGDVTAKPVYTCPMHPEVRSEDAESDCPECGMTLVLQQTEDPVVGPVEDEPLVEPTVVAELYIPAMGQTVNDGLNNFDKLWFEAFLIRAGDEIDVEGFEIEDESDERAYPKSKVDILLLRLKKGLAVKMLGCIFTDKEKNNREESYLPVIATERNGHQWHLINLDPIKDLMNDSEVEVSHYIIAETDNYSDARKYLDRGIIKIRADTFQPAENENEAGVVESRVWTTRFETRSDVVAVVLPEVSPDGTVYYNFAFKEYEASEEAEVEPVDPEDESGE